MEVPPAPMPETPQVHLISDPANMSINAPQPAESLPSESEPSWTPVEMSPRSSTSEYMSDEPDGIEQLEESRVSTPESIKPPSEPEVEEELEDMVVADLIVEEERPTTVNSIASRKSRGVTPMLIRRESSIGEEPPTDPRGYSREYIADSGRSSRIMTPVAPSSRMATPMIPEEESVSFNPDRSRRKKPQSRQSTSHSVVEHASEDESRPVSASAIPQKVIVSTGLTVAWVA